MQRSKNLAVMFLLGAVLVGGALGFTADRMMMRDQLRARENSPRGRLRLADRLQLDSAQSAKVDSLLDDRRRHLDLIMATVRDQLDSVRMRSTDQIRLILTDEQRAKFDALIAEMNDRGRPRDKDDKDHN
jgi:Spy/CpxP family protein refolding chaperone